MIPARPAPLEPRLTWPSGRQCPGGGERGCERARAPPPWTRLSSAPLFIHHEQGGKVENYNDLVKWTYPNVSSIDQNWFLTNNVPHQSTFIFHELHKNFLFTDHRLSIGNDALVLGKIAQNYETVFIDEVITKVELGGDSNNWKSLLRVYDYNYQTFIVNKELGRKTSYIALIYQNIRSSIQYFVFKYLGRKYFYKFFYRKYIKKND